MVRFDDPEYTKLSKTRKREFITKKENEADAKLEDFQFFIDLVQDYKAKLAAEKAKN